MHGSLGVMVVAVSVGALAGTADAKGGGIIVPPLRIEAGVVFPVVGGEAVEPGSELLVGLHWSALAWKPTTFDLGVGYIGSQRPIVGGYRISRTAEHGTNIAGEPDDTMFMTGGYLALGKTLVNQPHFRTWVELRGELLKTSTQGREFSTLGGAVRFSAEVYGSGAGGKSDHNSVAIFAGTISVGVYLEASHRDIPLELGPTGLSGGVSIRLPFILAGVTGC